MQGIEYYRSGVILYTLGNFFFWNYRKRLGHPLYGNGFALVACEAGREGITVDVVPGEMDRDNRLRVFEDPTAFHEQLREYSGKLAMSAPEYEAFWMDYKNEMEAYLRRTALQHASAFISSPREASTILRKIRKRGLRYAIARVKAKLSARVKLLGGK